ncbi:hypothetical protein A1O7_08259 [Cladophialophora yegresii CBS 114405]|uniref:BZIP domain-containing protein n=1 Tax=Cladophialophora yegresii CBS 114405 TaxID=1182544 RepID=W9VI77_9EURO|nr:uncharacterized protein A1O7_08259 [Cladophialophora yegresii CBS 114405]EXJ55332.1 hypothetical protein A1O7_08259 [Cladophialophora yegresii CBS 114405]
MTFSFAESFFANPFAVSFPGDLPCPSGPTFQASCGDMSTSAKAVQSGERDMAASPSAAVTASKTPRSSQKADTEADHFQFLTPPTSMASTPATLCGGGSVSKPKNGPSKYGPQIHFVDMADKKGAQRIRNTMNSRKHRQNKLDKIRELEKKLADLVAEKDSWQKGKVQQ